MKIGAKLEVGSGKEKQLLEPYQIVGGEKPIYQDVFLPGQKTKIGLGKILADTKQVVLLVRSESDQAGPKETLLLEVSHKPLINILWLGTILIILGSTLSIKRRTK